VSPEEATGKSFFEQVAPCTHADRFSGTFFDGVMAGNLEETFTYTFSYRMDSYRTEPLIVKIRLCRDPDGELRSRQSNAVTVRSVDGVVRGASRRDALAAPGRSRGPRDRVQFEPKSKRDCALSRRSVTRT
jgi:hypothetical protein